MICFSSMKSIIHNPYLTIKFTFWTNIFYYIVFNNIICNNYHGYHSRTIWTRKMNWAMYINKIENTNNLKILWISNMQLICYFLRHHHLVDFKNFLLEKRPSTKTSCCCDRQFVLIHFYLFSQIYLYCTETTVI